ncbi:hypothetical protein ACQKOA_26290 [Bacillus mobilis]|uniref:hypothetical protein n=1 Tax=Bacillus mobilis TaxID=2026190 RepID=UPI003D049D12
MGFIVTLIVLIFVFGLIDKIKNAFAPKHVPGTAINELSERMGRSKETIVSQMQAEWESYDLELRNKLHQKLRNGVPIWFIEKLYNHPIHKMYEKTMIDLFIDNYSYKLGELATGNTKVNKSEENEKIILNFLYYINDSKDPLFNGNSYKWDVMNSYRPMMDDICKLGAARGKFNYNN